MTHPSKKFFDIVPPQYLSRNEKSPVVKKKISRLPKKKSVPAGRSWRKFFPFWKPLVIIVAILVIAMVISYFSFASVQIEIWPQTQTYHLKEKVEISTKQNQVDLTAKVLPGKIIQKTQQDFQEFPVKVKTFKKEQARGVIRVYNDYSSAPQVLIASTRFVSAEGKLFRSEKKVTIPGQAKEGSKLTPGFFDVEVAAAEAGSDYNIGPSTFSIPGFNGTPKYTAFYGKSSSAMTGGFVGEMPDVSQKDLDSAKDNIVASLSKKGKEVLKKELAADYIFLDQAQSHEVAEAVPVIDKNPKAQTFKFQVKLLSKILVFKMSDLQDFAAKIILSQATQNDFPKDSFWTEKKIVPDILKMNYQLDSIDWQDEKMILNLDFSSQTYLAFDELSLKKSLAGKSLRETQTLLENQDYISRAKIKILPLTTRKIPQNLKKIKIKLHLES